MNCMIGIEIRPVYMTPSSKRWKIVLKRIRNKLHHLHRLLIITCLRSYMMCRHLLYSITLQRAIGKRKVVNRPNVIGLILSACSPTKQTVPKICKIDRKLVVTSCNWEFWKMWILPAGSSKSILNLVMSLMFGSPSVDVSSIINESGSSFKDSFSVMFCLSVTSKYTSKHLRRMCKFRMYGKF